MKVVDALKTDDAAPALTDLKRRRGSQTARICGSRGVAYRRKRRRRPVARGGVLPNAVVRYILRQSTQRGSPRTSSPTAGNPFWVNLSAPFFQRSSRFRSGTGARRREQLNETGGSSASRRGGEEGLTLAQRQACRRTSAPYREGGDTPAPQVTLAPRVTRFSTRACA